MRDSIVFYRSFVDAIRDLPPEQFKACALAIIDYGMDGIEPEGTGIEKTVYCMAKPQIDANNRRYENGSKGGRPRTKSELSETKLKPKETKAKPKETTPEPNVYVNDNVNVNDKDNNMSSRTSSDRPVYPYRDIIDYLNTRAGKTYRSTSADTQKHIRARFNEGYTLDDFKKVIDTKVAEWGATPKAGEKDMRQYLRPSTLFGSKFESYLNQEKSEKKLASFVNVERRNYDMDKLEKQLLSN